MLQVEIVAAGGYSKHVTRECLKRLRALGMIHRPHGQWKGTTELPHEFGLETARIPCGEQCRTVGHRSATTTKAYAELDQKKAIEATMRVG